MADFETIPTSLNAVRRDIERQACDGGRDPAAVTLIAVSKKQETAALEAALAAGQRVFGENYVKEAQAKWPALRVLHPDIELHLIGPLQSNKTREAVALFDVIQTLDRASLAEALAKERIAGARLPRLFVQVNTGEEAQKGGVLPREADAFLMACRDRWDLKIEGLMGIPPLIEPPSPHFALLRQIASRHGLQHLSMGMSADYRQAIQLDATHIRVGTAIFGARGA